MTERTSLPSGPLPSGTVTFLFSDIEGSTNLARVLGPGWSAVLGLHRDLLRAAFRAHDGHELGTEGDSFFVVFPEAREAVLGAIEAQRALSRAAWPDQVTVKVRMGLHTAQAEPRGSEYEGLEVHRAARIGAAAHGGQVVVSATTAAAVGPLAGDEVGLTDLGSHRLKDFPELETLHQLVAEGLPTTFPPLRSLGSRRADLPAQVTSFVGRGADLAAVKELVGEARVVTLTGPGGSGKTRLALRASEDLLERFPDGASFVPLAPVADPALVPAAIAHVVGIQDVGETPVETMLREWLRERDFLLVLDNFEHLVAAAPIVTELTASAPRLHVLVTSRELLRVAGERGYAVPPMSVPGGADGAPLEDLQAVDSVALFVERARAVAPGFALTQENADAVVEICRRLDGLPLAIELAAARLRILSPQALRDRLGRSLDLVSGGARDVPTRQRTLRAAIEWSDRLLEPPEARLFRMLAVFRGGWTIDAAEAVAGRVGSLRIDVLDGLSSLADKSLIRPLREGAEPRFLMLETIREYGLERLDAEGERAAVESAHAAHFAGFAEEARDQVEGHEGTAWMDRLDREGGNVRAALDWLLDHEPDVALGMGADLWRYWQRRGHLGEGRRWLERAVASPGARSDTVSRGRALGALGSVAYWQNDFERTRWAYEESLAAWRRVGDEAGLQEALYNLGFVHLVEHRFPEARAAYAESLALAERRGDERAVGRLQFGLGMTALVTGDLDEAKRRYVETIRILEPLADDYHIWTARRNIVEATTRSGRLDEADELNREVATHFHEAGDLPMLAMALEDFASIESMRGAHLRAIRLAGAAAGVKERAGGEAPPPLITVVDVRAAAAGALEEGEIERTWEEGRRLDDDGAYAMAMDEETARPG